MDCQETTITLDSAMMILSIGNGGDFMWEIVIMVVFLIIGFLLGFYLYVSSGNKIQTFLHREPKHKNKNPRKNMLEERMKKQNQSWTEFNCGLDDMDEAEHILSSRKKEDQAYCYPKRKEGC